MKPETMIIMTCAGSQPNTTTERKEREIEERAIEAATETQWGSLSYAKPQITKIKYNEDLNGSHVVFSTAVVKKKKPVGQ